jgi:hydrogenase maturation factor HypF (carbamoyltransferase family)
MLIKNIDDVNYLDYRRIVQSIMSYKMAGVENTLLAFSFYESLSEFIVDYAAKMKDEIKSSDIVLCGDMFANSILASKTNKALEKTFNVLLPKEYPLDMYQ